MKITVDERNDPVVVVWINIRNPDGTLTPFDFLGGTAEFWQKPSATDTDPALPTYVTTNGSVVIEDAAPKDQNGVAMTGRPERNTLSIHMSAANLAAAGVQFFRIDSVKSGKRTTVASGPLEIRNV